MSVSEFLMDEIQELRRIYALKRVERQSHIEDRHESAAEHSWSCLMLAEFFISRIQQQVNRLKVFELLMYHDLVEIETGDEALHPAKVKTDRSELELKAAEELRTRLPEPMGEKLWKLYNEFAEQKTIEARFARAIDVVDAVITGLDSKKYWKGWTKEFLVEHKEKYLTDFPEIRESFRNVLDYAEKEGYFSQ